MSGKTREQLVVGQFGAQAHAYLDSAVHAEGEDLAAIGDLVRERVAAGGARVLDLGCGGGHVAYAAAQAGAAVVAYDLSRDMLAVVETEARWRGLAITTVEGPAERLPFDDAEFDVVLSRYSAHHWQDFQAGLREAARVLRPGGRAAFFDVVSAAHPDLDTFLNAVELLRDTSHVRDYTVAEWLRAAGAAGLLMTAVTTHRLRLDYDSWIARMRTPGPLAAAVRLLQGAASTAVARHFAIEADGSFSVDTALLRFDKP